MIRVLWIVGALLGATHLVIFHSYLTDDAFISFRYLDHWLAGQGLVYNADERVWGFTNFAWILLLAPARALGADPILAARTLGLLSTTWIALFVAGAFESERFERREGHVAALLLLVCNGGFLLQAWGGLETSMFSSLVLGSLFMMHRGIATGSERRVAVAGVLAAAASLTRPEGLLVLGGLVFALGQDRRARRIPTARAFRALAVGFAPLVLPCALVLSYYYRAPWPNPITAKVGTSWEQLARGAHYVSTYALHYPATLVVMLAALLCWRRLRSFDRTLVVTGGSFAILVAAAGGDWMFGYRLLHPVTALSCAIVPGLVGGLGNRAVRSAMVATLCLVILQFTNTRTDFHVFGSLQETYVHQGIRIGRWMRENLPPDTLLATNTAGTIPYYSKLRVVDMMGLSDRTIAERTNLPTAWKGIEKGDGRYVLGRRPDFIQFASSLGSPHPKFLSDIEIYLEPEFHERYDLVSLQVDADTRVDIYHRRKNAREAGPSEDEWLRIRAIAHEAEQQSRYRY